MYDAWYDTVQQYVVLLRRFSARIRIIRHACSYVQRACFSTMTSRTSDSVRRQYYSYSCSVRS